MTQPNALRLADALESDQQGIDLGAEGMGWGPSNTVKTQAAAELRRLHEVNQELLEALKLADAMLSGANMNAKIVERKVKAAIAKAGEQT